MFVYDPRNVQYVYHVLPDGNQVLLGSAEEMRDSSGKTPSTWAIDPWGLELDPGRYDSLEHAALRLLEIHQQRKQRPFAPVPADKTQLVFNLHQWALKAQPGDVLLVNGVPRKFLRRQAYHLFFTGDNGQELDIDIDDAATWKLCEPPMVER